MAKQTKIVRFAEFEEKSTVKIEPYAKGSNIKAFMNDVAMAFSSDAKLRRAVQSEHGQESAVNALKAVASLGLSLNPAMKECALVTFKNSRKSQELGYDVHDVTFIPMKNGYIRKACESGSVEGVFPESVYTNDVFKLRKTAKGDDYDLEPNPDDRGEFRGCFALLCLKSGRTIIYYMSKKQLEEHRARWCSNKQMKPLWWDKSTFPAMGEKTCIKYVCEKNGIPVAEQLPEDLSEIYAEDPEIVPPENYTVVPAEEIAADIEQENETQSEQDPF